MKLRDCGASNFIAQIPFIFIYFFVAKTIFFHFLSILEPPAPSFHEDYLTSRQNATDLPNGTIFNTLQYST